MAKKKKGKKSRKKTTDSAQKKKEQPQKQNEKPSVKKRGKQKQKLGKVLRIREIVEVEKIVKVKVPAKPPAMIEDICEFCGGDGTRPKNGKTVPCLRCSGSGVLKRPK